MIGVVWGSTTWISSAGAGRVVVDQVAFEPCFLHCVGRFSALVGTSQIIDIVFAAGGGGYCK